MSFIAQVRHVFLKDVREVRWALMLYAALVLGVTLHVSGWLSASGIPHTLWMLVVMVAAMVVAALVLHTDPPVRSDAFWSSRPLAPGAVLAAKLAMAAALVLIATVGQLAAVWSFGIPFAAAAMEAAKSALIFMPFLILALVIAAASRDMKTFTLLLVVTIPVLAFGGALIGTIEVSPGTAAALGAIRAVAGVTAGMGALLWLYRARDVMWRQRSLACAAVVLIYFAPPTAAPAAAEASLRGSAAPPDARVTLAPMMSTRAGGEMSIRANVERDSESLELALSDWQVTVFLPDTSFTTKQERPANLAWASRPDIPGARWLTPDSPPGSVEVDVSLTASQRALVGRGVDSVAVEGDLVTTRSVVVAAVPIIERARLANRGWRFYVEDLGHDGRHASVDLRTSTVRQAPTVDRRATFTAPFALVNRARGEAIELNSSGSGGTVGGLVLPGVTLESFTYELSTDERSGFRNSASIDATWLQGAELVAIEQVPGTSRPIRLTTR